MNQPASLKQVKKDVKITKSQNCEGRQLSDTFYKNCQFCEKLVQIHANNYGSCLKIGGGKFYCPFCLRNNFHHKLSKNVLVYSFRSVIGYYYYKFYIDTQTRTYRKMWLTQIQDMIANHAVIGLASPVLTFDSETFLWFADFNKIGKHTRKAPYKEVKSIIHACFESFGVEKNINTYSKDQFWEKFCKALDSFYEQRQRPKERKMLIPTFCHHQQEKMEFHDKTRDFISQKLLLK